MLRRHSLPMILTASALALAACSPKGSGNVTATDNSNVEALSNETVANDELGTTDNAVAPDDLLGQNEVAANAATAR